MLLALALCGPTATSRAAVDAHTIALPRIQYAGTRTMSIPRFNASLGALNSVTFDFQPIVSGTISGTGTGPANSPNGWSYEFSGSTTLSGPGFGTISRSFFYNGSGLVWQPGTPVFFAIGPATLTGSPIAMTTGLAGYTGTGTVAATLSANFYTDLFWSRSGTHSYVTELGATLIVTYDYSPPGDFDRDGHVDVTDLLILVDAFGSMAGDPNYDPRCDLNADNSTDVVDLLYFVDTFGKY